MSNKKTKENEDKVNETESVVSQREKASAKDRYQIGKAFRYKGEGYEPGDKVPEMDDASRRSLIHMGRIKDTKKPEAGDEATTAEE